MRRALRISVTAKKAVVLEFWATWCPLCRQLEPALAAAKEKYGDRVTFVGLAMPQGETREQVKAFVKKNGMKGTYLFDTDGNAYKALASTHTSYVIVADTAGTIVYTGVGGTQDLDAAIAKLGLPAKEGAMMMMRGMKHDAPAKAMDAHR